MVPIFASSAGRWCRPSHYCVVDEASVEEAIVDVADGEVGAVVIGAALDEGAASMMTVLVDVAVTPVLSATT